MIDVTNKMRRDLIDDVSAFDIMAVISSATETFYISTREQYFEGNFYEDYDLNIGSLKESINFKTKKIKISSTSVTLNNFEKDGLRFTDRAKHGLLNATVDIYLKTATCDNLSDCAKIAMLKVARFNQDPQKVTLKCEEYLSNALQTELPRKETTLFSEDNDSNYLNAKTQEIYNNQRVPILYGHLEEAPAISYMPIGTGQIRIIPDLVAGVGIKDMPNPAISTDVGIETDSNFGGVKVTQLIDQDVLTIKLGDAGARVYKHIPRQANDKILRSPFDRQFDVRNESELNFVDFYTERIDAKDVSPFLEQGALLVGELSKLTNAVAHHNVYAVDAYRDTANEYFRFNLNNNINNLDFSNSDLFTEVCAKWGDVSNFNGSSPNNIPYSQRIVGGEEVSVHLGGSGAGSEGDHYLQSNPCIDFQFEEMKCDSDIFKDNKGIEAPSDYNLITFAQVHHGWDDAQYQGYYGYQPKLAWCFFPGKADQTFGNALSFKTSFTEDEKDEYFQSENPLGFHPNVLNGAVADFEFDPEEYSEEEILEKNTYEGLNDKAGTSSNGYYYKQQKVPSRIAPMLLMSTRNYVGTTYISNTTYDAYPIIDYRHCFNYPLNDSNDKDINQWRNRSGWVSSYSMHDTRSVLLNFVPFSGSTTDDDAFNDINYIDMDFYAEFAGMLIRRTWFQKDAFNKKFFLNAKGRYDNYLPNPENRIWRVDNAILTAISKNKRPSGDEGDFGNSTTAITQNDSLLRYVLDYIGNKKLKYREQGDYSSEIMLKLFFEPDGSDSLADSLLEGEIDYVFDLELNQFTSTIQIGVLAAYPFQISGTLFRQNSPYYEQYGTYNDLTEDVDVQCKNISLVYCRKNIDVNGNVTSIDEVEEIVDFTEEVPDNDEFTRFRLKSEDISPAKKLITIPKSIAKDLLVRELQVPSSQFITKNTNDSQYSLSFSLHEPQRTVDVLQKICENSNSYYKTSIKNSVPTFIGITDNYISADKTIYVDYMESYKFSKTKIEDLAIKCRVKYGYDYIAEEYKNITEERIVPNIENYKNYYGLTDSQIDGEDFLLEHEAPYIQDSQTALLLRNHLHELHKNQHTIVDFKLNLSQGFDLEVGDIVDFKTIGSDEYKSFFSPYGVDIMAVTGLPMLPDIIGDQQAVLPYFMLTDVTKTMNGVSVRAIQMHDLSGAVAVPGEQDEPDAPQVLIGDVDNDGEAYTINDFRLLYDFVMEDGVLDEQQLLNADIAGEGDGNVDVLDLMDFVANVKNDMGDAFLPGDANLDGVVTEEDIELVQSYIDNPNTSELTMAGFINADMDENFIINEVDIEAIDALLPPDEAEATGQLLIDTTNDNGYGAITLGYTNNEIAITFLKAVNIDAGDYELEDFLLDLENNDLTLVGTNITFQPLFTGELDYTNGDIINITYPWLEAAGDYTINAIEYNTSFGGLYTFRLDASGIDSTGLTDLGTTQGIGGTNDVNVKIYGTPETIFVPDPDGDGYVELLSTRHYYEQNGYDSYMPASYTYSSGAQLQGLDNSEMIITGNNNTILPNATFPELRGEASDLIVNGAQTYYRLNFTFNEERANLTSQTLTDDELTIINNWLQLNGCYARLSGSNANFMRFNWGTLLNPDGGDTEYDWFPDFNVGLLQLYPSEAGGFNLTINADNLQLVPSIRDFLILTIEYPLDYNE